MTSTDFMPVTRVGLVSLTLPPGDDGDGGEIQHETYKGRITLDGCWVHCEDDGLTVPAHRVIHIFWDE